MGQRRTGFRSFVPISAIGAWLLAALLSLFFVAAASAAPLDGVTASVNEVTEPVTETVESVVSPVTSTPPPSEPPPPTQALEAPVKTSPVKVPAAPAKAPALPATQPPSQSTAADAPSAAAVSETATHVTAGATEAVTQAASTVTGAATGATSGVGRTSSSPSGPGSAAADDPGGGPSAAADLAPAVAADGPGLAGMPARLLDPYIHVWPAIALLAEGSLDGFLGHWSRSVLALFEENGTGSLRGEPPRGDVGALAGSLPVSDSPDQPPFSWLTSPSLQPFNGVASEGALVVLALFLVLAAATLSVFAVARRELGLPLFRRRHRFPWRQ